MKTMPIISLSFDDGRADNYILAKEVLLKHNIPVTFNISTGYIEKKCKIGTDNLPMTKDQVIELYNSGLFEIAGHGNLHKNDFKDIKEGKEILKSWLPQQKSFGFASPGSQMSFSFIEAHKKQLQDIGFIYIRTEHEIKKYIKAKTLFRKFARISKSSLLYKWAYYDLSTFNGYAISSIPVFKFTTLRQLKSLIKHTVKKNGFLTLMFHSVCKKSEAGYKNIYSYDWKTFNKLIKFISDLREKGELNILTTEKAIEELKKQNH